jgi:DNA-binding response OmpR family regulator
MDKKRILVIDDDPDVRHGLDIRLKANGFIAIFAADALMALSVAQKEKPDLILLDLGLPGGDGFVVMKRFKMIPALASIPIIVVTAKDPFTHKDWALEAGAEEFFQKPFDNEKLLSTIRKILGEDIKVYLA